MKIKLVDLSWARFADHSVKGNWLLERLCTTMSISCKTGIQDFDSAEWYLGPANKS